jgi:hypothetical protein
MKFRTIASKCKKFIYFYCVYKMRSSLQYRQGPPGVKGDKGEKGDQGARGLDGPIGPIGSPGQTICHYVFPITTTTIDSELPTTHIGVSTATKWNTYRNSSVYPSYIAWNRSTQLESNKLYVSWIDNSGTNIRNFMSMLRINDIVTIQSKTNYMIKQSWKLNTVPIAYDNYIELSITLAQSDSAQIAPPDHTHVLFIFTYNGNALLPNANATESRIAALEEKVATLTARLASVNIP